MNRVKELYRKLNRDGIPEIKNDEGEIAFTPDQMIWFGNEVLKNCSIPDVVVPMRWNCDDKIDQMVREAKRNVSDYIEMLYIQAVSKLSPETKDDTLKKNR